MLLHVEFDGAGFHGWQLQNDLRTVQGELETVLERITAAPVRAHASSRTDAGVHAMMLPVVFDTNHSIPLIGIVKGMNSNLPEDVAVLRAAEVVPDFDVRGTAKEKTYQYRIWNARTRSSHRRHDHWHVPTPLSLDRMQDASSALIGEHDFSAFRTSQCQAKHAIRQITAIELTKSSDASVQITIRGNAFLHNMVRIIAGTLVDIGRGHRDISAAEQALNARDRALAGPTAPAHGLTLVQVRYSPDPFTEAKCWP